MSYVIYLYKHLHTFVKKSTVSLKCLCAALESSLTTVYCLIENFHGVGGKSSVKIKSSSVTVCVLSS